MAKNCTVRQIRYRDMVVLSIRHSGPKDFRSYVGCSEKFPMEGRVKENGHFSLRYISDFKIYSVEDGTFYVYPFSIEVR